MNIIDKLTEYRELLRELEKLNPRYKGELTIHMNENTVISATWEKESNEGGRRFHEKQFPLKDLDGIMRNLKERVKYWKEKQEHSQ